MASHPTTPESESVNLERPPATYSPLMDKLPAEIRLHIFRCVFETDTSVVEQVRGLRTEQTSETRQPAEEDGQVASSTTTDTRPRVPTDLFTVSRKVHEEALDAFFGMFTVIATDLQPDSPHLPRVRHIEFQRSPFLPFWPEDVLQSCSSKLKSVTLARDNLSRHSTVREYFEAQKPDYRLECTGIEKFQAEKDEEPDRTIIVDDFEVCSMIGEAKKYGSGIDDIAHMFRKHAAAIRVWKRMAPGPRPKPEATVARFFLVAYEAHRLAHMGMVLPDSIHTFDQMWIPERILNGRGGLERMHEKLPNRVRIADLNVKKHGSEMVEWATELIALSMRAMTAKVCRDSSDSSGPLN